MMNLHVVIMQLKVRSEVVRAPELQGDSLVGKAAFLFRDLINQLELNAGILDPNSVP